jgi:PAS domain S-box-containing protein
VFLILVALLLGYRGYRLSAQARAEATERRALAAEANSLAARVEQAQGNFESIFSNAIEGIFQSTPEGSFITANPALARMLGRESVDELINDMAGWPGRHFFADNLQWTELTRYLEQQESVADFQVELMRKDGRTIWVSENLHAVRDEDGKIAYLEGTILDITEKYWAELRRTLQLSTARILS